jgi:hypothetical protein
VGAAEGDASTAGGGAVEPRVPQFDRGRTRGVLPAGCAFGHSPLVKTSCARPWFPPPPLIFLLLRSVPPLLSDLCPRLCLPFRHSGPSPASFSHTLTPSHAYLTRPSPPLPPLSWENVAWTDPQRYPMLWRGRR